MKMENPQETNKNIYIYIFVGSSETIRYTSLYFIKEEDIVQFIIEKL
jgi:hypothetical protein